MAHRFAREGDVWYFDGMYYQVRKGDKPDYAPQSDTMPDSTPDKELWAEGYANHKIWDMHWLEDNCEYVGNHYD